MDYDDDTQDLHIHLKAGQQKINGEKAEQLVRFRHNNNGTTYSAEYGDNDEGRMRTQREFLKAIATQVVQWNNIDKVKEITNAIFKNLKTDITLSKILGYVPYATSFDVNNLEMDQLPGAPEKINELWFYKADTLETSELINGYIQKLGLDDKEKAKYIKKDIKTTKTTKNKNTTTKNETTNKKNTVVNQTKNTTKNNVKNTVKEKNETKKQIEKNNDDDEKKEKYIPYVIEPSLGADRVTLAFLCSAYDEEELEGGDTRTVMHFHPALAPVKIGVLPLSKKLNEGAEKVFEELSKYYNCEYDDRGNIGKRYRRQDEIGTPFCITYDFDSEEDGMVTVRDRDTMEQERIKITDLKAYFEEKFTF